MADRRNGNVANEISAAPSVVKSRTTTPHSKGWRSCWGSLQCFVLQKREKGIASTRLEDGSSIISENVMVKEISELSARNEAANLSPTLYAPPSSPASIFNSEIPSMYSPGAIIVSLSSTTGKECSAAPLQLDSVLSKFATGPYATETALVTPPVFSTLTTAPTTPLSTAPFTPPPELAHLTSPPSPDVPFAEFLSSSLTADSSLSEPSADLTAPLKLLPLTDLALTYHLHPGSPIGHLASPRSGASVSEISSPLATTNDLSLQKDFLVSASMSTFSLSDHGSLFEHLYASGLCFTRGAQILQEKHCMQHDGNIQNEGTVFKKGQEADKRENQEWLTSLLPNNGKMDAKEALSRTPNDKNMRQHRSDILAQGGCDKTGSTDPVPESKQQMLPTEVIRSKFDGNSGNHRNEEVNSEEIVEDEVQTHMDAHCFEKCDKTTSSSLEYSNSSTLGNDHHCGATHAETSCSKCGELTSRCMELSEALRQAKDKLILIERKESLVNDQERKYGQLMQWMQLGVSMP